VSQNPTKPNAQLIVDRNSDDDIMMRDLYVKVDEMEERNVLFGKSLTYSLPPGDHEIKITNRLFSKSETFTVGPGQTMRFQVANVRSGGLFAPLLLISGTGAYKVRLAKA
jgi:hypothetical protein